MIMFVKLADNIVKWMLNNQIIEENKAVICRWGISHILDTVFNIVTFLIIGFLFKMPIETIIFTLGYIPLRIYAGGYHAKTPFRCWCLSNIILAVSLVIVQNVEKCYIAFGILSLIAIVVLIVFMPVEDLHKPLDQNDRKKYKKRGVAILAIEICISFVFTLLHHNKISLVLSSVWVLLSVMLILGVIKNALIKK
jgi:accessory gene regulator B